ALPPTAPLDGARILTHRLPLMERAMFTGGYRAFDAYSGDRHAVLDGITGIEGLFLATGFSGAGFKIAPAVGLCVADVIAGEPARTVDVSAFGLERFRQGTPLEGPYPYAPWKPHVEPSPARRP
ncbi:MAG: FAD-binding oxidoreductase, partial [Candidatus Rokubacteria bacterium]|nr:FAD-binding oxidoreductase [Candidatus Rokubacteria bacterium]